MDIVVHTTRYYTNIIITLSEKANKYINIANMRGDHEAHSS